MRGCVSWLRHGRLGEGNLMSALEDLLAFHIKAYGLPTPEREYRISKDRKFRFDFAFEASRVVVECQGGIYIKSGHTTPSGITRDAEKINYATLHGWHILVVTADHVKSGQAIQWIKAALELYPPF